MSIPNKPGRRRGSNTLSRIAVLATLSVCGLAPTPAVGSMAAARTFSEAGKTRIDSFLPSFFGVRIDPSRWRLTWQAASEKIHTVEFYSADDAIQALMVVEKRAFPADLVKAEFFTRTRAMDLGAQVEEERKVVRGGHEIDVLRVFHQWQGTPRVTYAYIFGGETGSYSLSASCTRAEFAGRRAEIEDFLDGIEIGDRPVPSTEASREAWRKAREVVGDGTGRLRLNGGRILLLYDSSRWTARSDMTLSPDGLGTAGFDHVEGWSKAVVVSETQKIAFESLPEWSLGLARRRGEKGFQVLLKEKLQIENRDFWLIGYRAQHPSGPWIYYGFLHSGPEGTFQALTRTEQRLFNLHQEEAESFVSSVTFP